MRVNRRVVKFVWDKGNIDKNWIKHRVINSECEEVFFDKKKVIFKDVIHSRNEERHRILGKTKKGRLLFVVFTIRENKIIREDKIRVISARDINKKERRLYEEAA